MLNACNRSHQEIPIIPLRPRQAVSRLDGGVDVAVARLGIERADEEGVISGVAAGVARRLDVDAGVVRLLFVVLATAGGIGIALYALGAALLPLEQKSPSNTVEERSAQRGVGLALITAGVLFLCRASGLWIADALTWPVALAAAGSATVWTRASQTERLRWRSAVDSTLGTRGIPRMDRIGPLRSAAGVLLVIAGMVAFIVTTDVAEAPDVLIASGVILVGVGLVMAPWVQALAQQVSHERRERIRSEERADMAAHLHDSVLQTLALIQRSGDPDDMARLARGQERELRSWLLGRRPDQTPGLVGEAIADVAGHIEDGWGIAVEVVLAGDMPLTDDVMPIVEAAREAMANAAKHAGVDRVDVFVEVDDQMIEVFVRDEGKGFDPEGVAADRQGVAASITGRMQRHGGEAHITSTIGEGTEVELRLPVPEGPSPTGPDTPRDRTSPDELHEEL